MGERELLRLAKRCMRCGFCRAECPLFRLTLSDGSTARGKLQSVLAMLRGEIGRSSRAMMRAFECTTCGACSAMCPAGVRMEEFLEQARRSFLQELELPVHEWMVEATLSTGNPFAAEFEASVLAGEVAFFPGCTSHFRAKEIERSCISLLKRSVRRLSVLRFCCGAPLMTFGGDAGGFVERNLSKLEGIEVVVCHCPTCTKVLRERYRVHAVHISQALLEFGGAEPLRNSLRAAYHDPCHLARGCGVVEEPRELLSTAGVELVELEHSGRATRCCGAGGGLPVSFPELSAELARRRLAAAKARAEVLLTFCPTCYLHLSGAAGESLRVVDASVLLAGGVHEVR
ncbi:MAG: (Fe-S)-binding protein [Euryarchaeota archaeon]|nr:(Fe-S)-binding protein [Euryarchaeota archaeon]